MTIKIEQAEDNVPQEELDFFLKGNMNIYIYIEMYSYMWW